MRFCATSPPVAPPTASLALHRIVRIGPLWTPITIHRRIKAHDSDGGHGTLREHPPPPTPDTHGRARTHSGQPAHLMCRCTISAEQSARKTSCHAICARQLQHEPPPPPPTATQRHTQARPRFADKRAQRQPRDTPRVSRPTCISTRDTKRPMTNCSDCPREPTICVDNAARGLPPPLQHRGNARL